MRQHVCGVSFAGALGSRRATADPAALAASDKYAESYMIATVIRPVLRASIDAGETFQMFLPKAVAKWRSFMPR